ncbi:17791_t:CDS:1, partial [Funneliformis caledonium]
MTTAESVKMDILQLEEAVKIAEKIVANLGRNKKGNLKQKQRKKTLLID